MTHEADYSQHTDAELREGIEKANANLSRISQEGSDEQRQAAEEQRDGMQRELARRQS